MVSNLDGDEINGRRWTIPDTRNKPGVPFMVYLTDEVADIIRHRNSRPFVFSSDGEKAFKGFSKAKKALDAKLAEIRKRTNRKPFPAWVFHDFRRTARGLMKNGGIDPDTCERALGHVITGVRSHYDVEDYFNEKAHALKVLAEQMRRILSGKSAKVVEFKKTA
jgi:integrase